MKFKKLSKIFLSFALFCFIFVLTVKPVYATDAHPMEHGTTTESSVSEEVDTAQNTDDDMSTQFYVYIPPEKANDMPNMGDTGVDTSTLLKLTILVGCAYLVCSRYANYEPKNCESV